MSFVAGEKMRWQSRERVKAIFCADRELRAGRERDDSAVSGG
ncbi:hypothetical protein HMPREF0262_03471 [Clostridium sp. ATCC 29733]|nr:hypothetical protein HMPREF0262_03471 [Clostridium sp. ATCC 29733]